MDVHIGTFDAEVRAVDDRTLVSPEVVDVIAREVLRRLESRQSSEAARRADATVWNSVREDAR
ncbi:hypothetical protein [Propioniciclava tarda]|jgi:hypothetical protein|uniref:Uncharacterized protein n=1 Tax=Propioniciclava tarda TaxID=433330 RepID=A0A4V2JT92_PROTD|nr:hypothetical protein [Propioniciclava tarda]TBT95371.1 hypothetical protein ET996_06060 [Propioniciclava tarda]SMO79065.1 hypothetical protein SAMN06266982_11949 [Propioniciclava tarda]HOA88675.1 hypothetical protein [Propioniciclava tarda]HQA31058.1 hypothetical protein [Propioniciclava tarda]